MARPTQLQGGMAPLQAGTSKVLGEGLLLTGLPCQVTRPSLAGAVLLTAL